MKWQRCHSQGMVDGDAQKSNPIGFQDGNESVRTDIKLQAAGRMLDADLDDTHG